ncbi:hypothetical protein BA059_16720 [Mycolicibacterium sp. (ex Dasyatis americana)]|nr:hypothetical protein BA059_16720 [Mycolicibacterium sp. (ex Dasyatis americana)]
MTARKGSLMRHMAECGHWMVVYSLEPTPIACPDCSDKLRYELAEAFELDPLLNAESESFDPGEFPGIPDELAAAIEAACVQYDAAAELVQEAEDLYATASREVREAIDKWLPAAERLVMP